MKKIMIIGAGALQVPLIQICKKNGYEVIVTDKNPDAIGFTYADKSIVVDGTDKEKILEYAKKFNIDGIVTTAEITLYTVAYVCEKLGLKGPSMKAAQISNDKYLMRMCMSENGIESPKFWLIHNIIELNNIENEITFPVIVKPVDVSGSLGVIKANNVNEIKLIFNKVLINSRNGKVIIEEFLDGPEFSVETLSQNGVHNIIAITAKTVLGQPYFVEERHIIPAKINKTEEKEIKDMVVRLLNACDFNNCAGHTEVKLTKDGARIIETGARIGGDYITSDLVPLATGISMHENIAEIALGEAISVNKKLNRYAGIQYIVPTNYSAILKKWDVLNKFKCVIRCQLDDNKEKNILQSSMDRLGYYICMDDSREDLIQSLDFYKE